MTIADRVFAETCRGHTRDAQEALDFGEKLLVHKQESTVCYTTLSRVSVLYHHLPPHPAKCDKAHMEASEFQVVLDAIRDNVAAAVEKKGVGLKPLAKQAGMGETVIRDLVKKHNKDVQISTLAKIAAATDTPLVDLINVTARPAALTRQSLERALSDAMPGLPAAEDRQAEYLAATVARVLRLPAGLRDAPSNDGKSEPDAPAADAPVQHPTK